MKSIEDNVGKRLLEFTVQEDDRDSMVGSLDQQDGQGQFVILSGDPKGILLVKGPQLELRPNSGLNRELKTILDLNMAFIGEDSSDATLFKVKVNFLPTTQHSPVFKDEDIEITLDKSTPVGESILKLNVEDLDGDKMIFSLDDPQEKLEVDQDGVIKVVKSLSSVSIKSWEIVAKASDESGLSSSKTYKVHLESKYNSMTPRFDYDNYDFALSESTSPGSIVLTVKATDFDDGANGEVMYGGVESDGPFGVFPDGRVFLRSALDREMAAFHAVKVRASDGGAPERWSEVAVVASVLDENDNRPVFDKDSYVFKVREGQQKVRLL